MTLHCSYRRCISAHRTKRLVGPIYPRFNDKWLEFSFSFHTFSWYYAVKILFLFFWETKKIMMIFLLHNLDICNVILQNWKIKNWVPLCIPANIILAQKALCKLNATFIDVRDILWFTTCGLRIERTYSH